MFQIKGKIGVEKMKIFQKKKQCCRKKKIPKILQLVMCHVSFKKKLILIYVFAVIIPVLLAGVFLTNRMYELAIGRAVDQTSYYAGNVQQKMNETTRLLSNLSDQIYTDESLAKIVAKKYESSWAVVTAMKNFTLFDDYTNYYKEIRDIRFYISVKNLKGNYNYVNTTEDLQNYPWYAHTISKKGLICWNMIYDEKSMRMSLALTRLLRSPNGADMGVLVILSLIHIFFKGMSFQNVVTSNFIFPFKETCLANS